MCGEHSIPIPDDTNPDVSELWVDDVRVVAWTRNEGFHDGPDIGPGTDVLAKLDPRMCDARADRTCVADERSRTTHPVPHGSCPTPCEVGELDIELQRLKATCCSRRIHLGDER